MKCQSVKEVSIIEKQDAEMDLLDLEEEIFMDCVFDVPSEERSPPPSYATPPMFVPSIGRGVRRTINPLDIPLPQAYYDQVGYLHYFFLGGGVQCFHRWTYLPLLVTLYSSFF